MKYIDKVGFRCVARWGGISAVMAGFVCLSALFVLFPDGFANVMGGTKMASFTLISCISLGSLLRGAVSRGGKRDVEWFMDRMVIVLLQAVILLGGLFFMAQNRPARLVWVIDHLEAIRPVEMSLRGEPVSISRRFSSIFEVPALYKWVPPLSTSSRQRILMDELRGKNVIGQLELLRKMSGVELLAAIRPLPAMGRNWGRPWYEFVVDGTSCVGANPGWLPLKANGAFHTAVVNSQNGRICRVVEDDLWNG